MAEYILVEPRSKGTQSHTACLHSLTYVPAKCQHPTPDVFRDTVQTRV